MKPIVATKSTDQRQQGDVLWVKVDSMPDGGKPLPLSERGYVIREGEATGHAHVLDPAGVLDIREVNGIIFARIAEDTTLRHDEHGSTFATPGIYAFGAVQEYDHFREEARLVID